MAEIILDNVTINQPVADATARNAIPTSALQIGDLVYTISENLIYSWNGTVWQEVSSSAAVNLTPWDAVVDGEGVAPGTYTSITAAITAGKSFIYNKTGSSDGSVINITRNIIVYYNSSTPILNNQAGYAVSANCSLTLYGVNLYTSSSSGIGSRILANVGSGYFFSGAGYVSVSGINFIQANSTGFISPETRSEINGCQFKTLGNNNNFVDLKAFGSTINNCFFYTQSFGSSDDNSLIVGNGCSASNIIYFMSSFTSGTMCTIQSGGKLTNLQATGQLGGGGTIFLILNQGYLSGVEMVYPCYPGIINDGGTLAYCTITEPADGFAPATSFVRFINSSGASDTVIYNVPLSVDAVALNTKLLGNSGNSTYTNTSLSTFAFANSGSITNTPSVNLDPFTAKVTTVQEWNAAIAAASNYIFIANGFSFNQNVQLLTNTKIYRSSGVQIEMNAYRIDINNFLLSEESATMLANGWNYAPVTNGLSPIFNSNGSNPAAPLQLLNTRWTNLGSAKNTSIYVDGPIIAQNVFVFSSNSDNTGINFNSVNSAFNNLVVAASAPLATNSFVAANNTVDGSNLTLANQNGVTGIYANFGQNVKISNITAQGGTAVNIVSNAVLSSLNSNDGTAINITLNGGAQPQMINSNLNSGSCTVLSGTQGAFILGSYATGVYLDNGTGTIADNNGGALPNNTTGSFDPFTSKVTSEAELIAAIAVSGNNYINIASNITLTANLTLTQNVFLFVSQGITLNLGAYVINRATHTLALQISQGAQLVYALDSSGSPFIDLSGTSVLTIGGQGAIINNSTAANTPLSDGNTILHYEGISFSDANLFNSGINLSTFGSYVDNAVMVTTGTISENSFVTTQGTFISNITILNLGLSENALLNNAKGASVSGLTLKTNGTPALIYALNSGRIENVTSADGSNLAVTNSISGITVNDANPFQAQINPNLSNLNAYATVNDAYLAGLTTALISANTAETTNLVLGAGDQLALTLGQNIDWDLSSFSVDGSAGIVSLLLTFSDPTSVLSYGKTSSGVPFSGFGVNTDLIIEGKGGLIRNTSSVGNAFITSEGTLHISDTYFLLPNQFNGGIVGNLTDTVVDKVYFEGAGAGTNVAFDAAGVFSNIKITNGAGWAEGANFNLATNVGLIQNYSVDVATPGTVNFNGRLSNFYCSSVSQVSLSAASDSILDGAKVAAGGLLGFSFDANISRVNIISAEITSSNAYANDNSNLDITYSGGVISADELIYGTICYVGTIFIGAAVNLNVGCVGCRFIGCTFDDCEITVPTGATDTSFCGNITRNGTTFSNSDPSTIRAGNDAVIGNT